VLIVFVAMIALRNSLIGWAGHFFGHPSLSFQQILGWIATPFAWLTGMPWHDAQQVGPLLGLKTAVNEFVAYLQMSQTLGANPHFIAPALPSSPSTPCVGSPTSPASPSRSAASAAWPRPAAPTCLV